MTVRPALPPPKASIDVGVSPALRDLLGAARSACGARGVSVWAWPPGADGGGDLVLQLGEGHEGAAPTPPWALLAEHDVVRAGPNGDSVTVGFDSGMYRLAIQLAGPGIADRCGSVELRTLARLASELSNGAHPEAPALPPAGAVPPPRPPRAARLDGDDRPIIGTSKRLREALDLLERVAPREIPVLLIGESGTGKELFARALHRKSARAGGPFLALNCGSVTPTLLESELFGYERGAFTGATQTTKGLFEEACGGTLFLDEVNELSAAAQVSLLRVLQEGEVRRVGGKRPVPVDVRIVAASQVDLVQCVEGRTFRSDLFYRLNVFPLYLPPLRERPEDIAPLVDHILEQIAAREHQPRLRASREAMTAFAGGTWPGNIRELQAAVERAAALARGGVIDVAAPVPGRAERARPAAREGRTLEDVEMAHILETLARNGNCRARTARELGISTNTLWRKLRQAGKASPEPAGRRPAHKAPAHKAPAHKAPAHKARRRRRS